MSSPLFSVIVPHYEGQISSATLREGLDCLRRQTCQNFEVLLYHDGPKRIPFESELDLALHPRIRHLEVTDRRFNDFGHSLRDLGIREARGEYLVHLNPDNVLYEFALERIVQTMNTPRSPRPGWGFDANSNDIIIFPILMIGAECDGFGVWQETREDARHAMILTGYPPIPHCIDGMQLVMRRSLWLSYGGWYDKSKNGDGVMYQRFVRERRARYVPAILGEHR